MIKQINFTSGFIRIPSINKVVNPDNIQTIGEESKGNTSYIMLDDCIEVGNINAPVSSIASACIEAQTKGTIVDVKENQNN